MGVKRQFKGNELNYIQDALDSGLLSSRYGMLTYDFEKRFASVVGAEFAVAVNSGTSALMVALRACGVKDGDQVIVPALGPTMTAAAVVHVGAVPIFADIDPETYCISGDSIHKRLNKHIWTTAVMPVHIFGNECGMAGIVNVAGDLQIIEDCAQAYKPNRKQYGHAACYSFEQSKAVCVGDGGMVVTDDHYLAYLARQWSDHGIRQVTPISGRWSGPASFDFPGYNFRMTELTAAVGLAQLEYVKGGPLYRTEHVTDHPDEYERHLRAEGVEFARAPWGKLVYQHEMFGAQKGLCPVAESIHPNLFIFPIRRDDA